MGAKVSDLVQQIRADKGPFFMARLCLRVDFALDETTPDSPNTERTIIAACKELGYDPSAPRREPLRK
jgi:hypothetical protein